MIVTIDNPKGQDYFIKQLQGWLQSALFPKWSLDPEDPAETKQYVFYPRVYRNQDVENGYIAELYTGNGNYREVYWDDTLSGLTWFGNGPVTQRTDGQDIYNVHLVTFANVDKLYGSSHRYDNEIRMDFQRVFETPLFGFTLVSTETGLSNVLKEYPGSRREKRLIAADMGKVHAFRLNLQLVVTPGDDC